MNDVIYFVKVGGTSIAKGIHVRDTVMKRFVRRYWGQNDNAPDQVAVPYDKDAYRWFQSKLKALDYCYNVYEEKRKRIEDEQRDILEEMCKITTTFKPPQSAHSR